MKSEVDYLIFLMDMISSLPDNVEKTEVEEQDGETSSTDTGGDKPDYPTVTKWGTGIARNGPGIQIGLTKWSDIVKITRGKANTLL
jgi:hypothetical protein